MSELSDVVKKTRQSYTNEFKLKACDLATETTNREAARVFGINESSVRMWLKSKSSLEKLPKTKRSRRFRKCHYPDLESELRQWILDRREEKFKVTETHILLKAMKMAKEKNIPNFKASNGWFSRFQKRSNICLSGSTSAEQSLSPYQDLEEKVENPEVNFVEVTIKTEMFDVVE